MIEDTWYVQAGKKGRGQTRTALLLLCAAMLWLTACGKGRPGVYDSPPGYNFGSPHVIKLPFDLDEVSGVAYYEGDNSLFMQVDEKGNIYKMRLDSPAHIGKWEVGNADDYEDIVLLDSVFYMLSSRGDITAIRISENDGVKSQHYPFPEEGNEFEILYFDSYARKLILICKDCEGDKKKTTNSFAFDPYARQFVSHAFSIDVKRINKIAGRKIGKFKPSAAGIHPLTGSLYIISATDKLLVVADRQGNAKATFALEPGMFKQPEGITFTPRGTMIISNEAADIGMANILIFPLNKTTAGK